MGASSEPTGDRRYYSPPKNPVADESAAINALTTEYEGGGSLSNLVWNRRNLYLHPAWENAEGDAMRMVCEGFLAEVDGLRVAAGILQTENARLRAALVDLATVAIEVDPVIAAIVKLDTGRVVEECAWAAAAALEKDTDTKGENG